MRLELSTHFQDVQTGNVRAEKFPRFEDYSRNPVDLLGELFLSEKSRAQPLGGILPVTPTLQEQCTAAPGCLGGSQHQCSY